MITADNDRNGAGRCDFAHDFANMINGTLRTHIIDGDVAIVYNVKFVKRRDQRVHMPRRIETLSFIDGAGAE